VNKQYQNTKIFIAVSKNEWLQFSLEMPTNSKFISKDKFVTVLLCVLYSFFYIFETE